MSDNGIDTDTDTNNGRSLMARPGSNVWVQSNNRFYPGSTAAQTHLINPGVYAWGKDMSGWFLSREAENFEFPYKVYGHHEDIIQRVEKAWGRVQGNLGIILNGLKGTGKTVAAQVLANWAIDHNVPVIVVTHPIPLSETLSRLQQPVAVIFDEFEKTHDSAQQQALLTALDGMARNAHPRLFIFTMNNKVVDPNFVDRPSRVRYCWEFERLGEDVIEALINDLLRPDLMRFRAQIVAYLTTRKVLSIDVVKTVINEVNTFEQNPYDFAGILNLSEQDAHSFTLELVGEDGVVIKTITSDFIANRGEMTRLRSMLTKAGREEFLSTLERSGSWYFRDKYSRFQIVVVDSTDSPSDWVCHLCIPRADTWARKYPKVYAGNSTELVTIDVKPADWKTPEWATKIQMGDPLTEQEKLAYENWLSYDWAYGVADEPVGEKFRVRITANFEPKWGYTGTGTPYSYGRDF